VADSPSSQKLRVNVTVCTPTTNSIAVVEVPTGPCDPIDLLPAFRSIDDVLVNEARQASVAAGGPVTCRKGCDWCCYQLVPVTGIEARWLGALVESLPTARRAIVQTRFAVATSQLAEAGLCDQVTVALSLERAQSHRLAARYFRLRIACPFLEDHQCSIYSERPLACREYVVTSPAQACETLGHVDRIPVPGRLSLRLGKDEANRVTWIPLVSVPEWVVAHAEEDQPGDGRTGPELLAEALGAHRG
jgi:Fe-S-cluster containining protein